jgi:predicted ATP-grasp superfamily ATP-dependent carboligase
LARVLILDGHSSAALAFVRSLGRAGHWVAVGQSRGSFAPASLSRYCRVRSVYPLPVADAAEFTKVVVDLMREHAIDVLLPMTDATLWPLARDQYQLRRLARLSVPEPAAIEDTSDKFRTVLLGRNAGVPVPRTLLIRTVGNAEAALEWGFPLVVKDRFSLRWVGNTGIGGSTSFAYSREQLCRLVQKRLADVGEIIVQEFAAGVGIGLGFLSVSGEIHIPFQWERVREKDPKGSGSSARKSTALDPEVLKLGQALMTRTAFSGLAMVEFKRAFRTGQYILMEINGRPWGSIQLPIHCGIDFPCYLLDWLLESRCPPRQMKYKEGITSRDLAADLTHLENLWQGQPPGWPVKYPNFFVNLFKVAVPWYPGLRYDDLLLSDPKPALAGVGRWLYGHLGGRQG